MVRRFPPPWSVEEQSACFVVRDHNGQVSISGMNRATESAAKLPIKDETRRIAANIAKLPELLSGNRCAALLALNKTGDA